MILLPGDPKGVVCFFYFTIFAQTADFRAIALDDTETLNTLLAEEFWWVANIQLQVVEKIFRNYYFYL
ncbi:hypothetical protein WN55_02767 [Dufourea novaeangliae]|uniref:Uncharacterized protein n=1 Tax=Dufourea novaeangliae TaxID=178035 RepID=A0A154NXK4_DUFNO|nr:hypothetical protein WN55_02767 [Dufourea novaeangliae]